MTHSHSQDRFTPVDEDPFAEVELPEARPSVATHTVPLAEGLLLEVTAIPADAAPAAPLEVTAALWADRHALFPHPGALPGPDSGWGVLGLCRLTLTGRAGAASELRFEVLLPEADRPLCSVQLAGGPESEATPRLTLLDPENG